MIDIQNEISYHKKLLDSDQANKIGKIHWYLLKADTEMRRKCCIEKPLDSFCFLNNEKTNFWDEVECDEIHWWVFKKEHNRDEQLNKTTEALENAQKLKDNSTILKNEFYNKTYLSTINKIFFFLESNANEIEKLYQYVSWLNSKDILAPSILFNYRVWGSTRLADRTLIINSNSVNEDYEIIKTCIEIALGLRSRAFYTIADKYMELDEDLYDERREKLHQAIKELYTSVSVDKLPSIDRMPYSTEELYNYVNEAYDFVKQSSDSKRDLPYPIEQLYTYIDDLNNPREISYDELSIKTSKVILDEIAEYFEQIRNCLRNIQLDLNKYNSSNLLLYDSTFWESVIKKSMQPGRIETPLWDFKETFEMWRVKQNKKEIACIDFCKDIAAYANNEGGVLIVGVTNSDPRKFVGITDLENKAESIKSTIKKYIDYDSDFTHLQQIIVKTENAKESCLIIAIAQTRNVVGVRCIDKTYAYPSRIQTGKSYKSFNEIHNAKRSKKIHHDNYSFISKIHRMLLET